MRKLSVFFVGIVLAFVFTFVGTPVVEAVAQEQTVYVGGMSAGFTLKTRGAQIIGISEVVTENGVYSPSSGVLKVGDIIQKAGGLPVEGIADLNEIVGKSKGKELELEISRGMERLCVSIRAVKEKGSERYKIGVLVRENVSGIGTITYIDKNGRFGALGHSVMGENNDEMGISGGTVYECSIVGVNKGVRGKAGELHGMFLNDKKLGNAEKLNECGIFGMVAKEFCADSLTSLVASSYDVKPGNAYIYSTVNGVIPKEYEIEIVKIDKCNKENKNYVIKITDEELIRDTGGIVQGMSGSPIVQNGRLVGAVTHVFVNDPTRGYGIEIEKMLRE